MNKSRDHSELQDMYRRALAASWAAQPGELPADQCVEHIFNGGDGWKEKHHEKPATPRTAQEDSASASGDEQNQRRSRHRTKSRTSSKSQSTITGKSSTPRLGHKHSRDRDTSGNTTGIQSPQNETSSENSERGRSGFRKASEVDEFEVRDNLVAWRLPGTMPA
jgi:hypothetical protein